QARRAGRRSGAREDADRRARVRRGSRVGWGRGEIAVPSQEPGEARDTRALARPGQAPEHEVIVLPLPGTRQHPARRAARHVGRHAHRLLIWLGSVAAVLILAFAFLAWRLMQGPIGRDRVSPYFGVGLGRSGRGLGVALSGVGLGIEPRTRQLGLWVEDAHLSLPGGEPLASFPAMEISFSLGELFRGWIEPTQLTVERPVVHLMRDESGAFTAQIGAPDQGSPGLSAATIQQLAGPPQ